MKQLTDIHLVSILMNDNESIFPSVMERLNVPYEALKETVKKKLEKIHRFLKYH